MLGIIKFMPIFLKAFLSSKTPIIDKIKIALLKIIPPLVKTKYKAIIPNTAVNVLLESCDN